MNGISFHVACVHGSTPGFIEAYIDGLVQEKSNSSALAMELRLSCTNPSIYEWYIFPCGLCPWVNPRIHSDSDMFIRYNSTKLNKALTLVSYP